MRIVIIILGTTDVNHINVCGTVYFAAHFYKK